MSAVGIPALQGGEDVNCSHSLPISASARVIARRSLRKYPTVSLALTGNIAS